MRNSFTLLTALLLSTSCTVGPDYTQPVFEFPDLWGEKADTAEVTFDPAEQQISTEWWKQFNDPALSALIDEALAANSDLLVAAARVSEARANLRLSESELYPAIDGTADAIRTGRSEVSATSTTQKPYNDFSLAAVLSYEIDIWGRIRRSNESARAQLLSVKANRDAIRNAVVSDVASGYFSLRALDAQIAITNDTITSRRASFDYYKRQYNGGVLDALSYRQGEAALASAIASLPPLEQARTEQQNALSLLLGRSPKAIVEGKIERGNPTLATPPALPDTLPSSLLERRPDVVSAEQSLIAANAAIGVAIADYFPKLSISALLGLNAEDADNLFKSAARNWQIGAGLSAPIFNAGRTSATVDVAKAQAEIAKTTYQQTVRTAFADVVNALEATRTSTARVKADTTQVNVNTEAERIAKRRYDAGYSEQLELLDTQRNLYAARLSLVTSERDRLIAYILLYKALGGGWETKVTTKE